MDSMSQDLRAFHPEPWKRRGAETGTAQLTPVGSGGV